MKYAIIVCTSLVVIVAVVAIIGLFFYFTHHSTASTTKNADTENENVGDAQNWSKSYQIVLQKCNEYVEVACSNPIPTLTASDDNSSRILGGTDAIEGMFPHMALLQISTNPFQVRHCGGALISEYFVLTAVHCVVNSIIERSIVKLGIVDRNKVGDGIVYHIDKIFMHDGYRFPRAPQYDIALVKLAKKVEFDWKKRPICLNTEDFYSRGDFTHMSASGWGTDETGKGRRYLQVLNQRRDKDVENRCFWHDRHHTTDMICVAPPDEDKSICQGDSGGPLQVPLTNENACGNPYVYKQLGIAHAINRNCTPDFQSKWKQRLAIYIKVDKFIDWIVIRVWPELLK